MGKSNLVWGPTINYGEISFGKAGGHESDLDPRQDLMGGSNTFTLTEAGSGGPSGILLGFGLNTNGEPGVGPSALLEVGLGQHQNLLEESGGNASM